MELNTMLCVGRSDLSGFNEGTTRRKLFTSMSPTSDSFENVTRMQQSPNTSLWRSSNPSTPPKRSSNPSTPPKKSILRGGPVVCLSQGSPSSLRSVRFSDDEDDLAIECTHIHVNRSTQTSGMMDGPDDNTKGTQTIPNAGTGAKQSTQTMHNMESGSRHSMRDSYIESVGSPKSPRVGSRSPSLTRGQDDRKHAVSKQMANTTSKSMQTSTPRISDGRKIIQNMEIAPVTVKEEIKPDGHKIIQNLELSKNKSKEVQTEELPKFTSESTQTPIAPDGNRIIQNMDIETPVSKHANTATQTPSIPDGSRIIQNMELDTSRDMEPSSRHAAVQTGTISSTTQTPTIPDGSKITQNMELLPPREDDSSFRSISIQTGTDPTGEQQDGQRIIQNMVVERIRSPSPDTMDCSFGFDVNLSFASTQTDHGTDPIPKKDTDSPRPEPVLIYNKGDTGSRPLVINHNDTVGSTTRQSNAPLSQGMMYASDTSKYVNHSARTLLERHTYSADTQHQTIGQSTYAQTQKNARMQTLSATNINTQTSSETHRNTQTTSATLRNTQKSGSSGHTQTTSGTMRHTQTASGTLKSPQGLSSYNTSQTSIQQKLLSRSYTAGYQGQGLNDGQRGLSGLPADKWIAPTIPTKLRSKSPPNTKQGPFPANTMSPCGYKATTPIKPQQGATKGYLDEKTQFRPQMTSSLNDIRNTNSTKAARTLSPVSRQREHTTTYTTEDDGKYRRESKLETFTRTAIDVYSFDPDSVEESKRVLSQSAYKESVTRNTFLKGIDLPVPAPVVPRSVASTMASRPTSSSYLTSSRPYSYGPYVQKVNLGRPLLMDDRKYKFKEASYSSRYSNLNRARSAGSSSTSSNYTSNYARSRSTSSSRFVPKTDRGYRSSNLTPALNQMRTSVIRKNSMNASTTSSTHVSRPSSGSSSGYSYREQTKINNRSSSIQASEHRSRSRETTRGTNSRYGQELYKMMSTTNATESTKSPLYIESLTDVANVRPRSKERQSKSKSPYATDRSSKSPIYQEHERSRSSSATRHVSRKPPLPQAAIRKPSPSPIRRPAEMAQSQRNPSAGHSRSPVPSSSRKMPSTNESQTYTHYTNASTFSSSGITARTRDVPDDTRDNTDLDPLKVTIGKSPSGLVDKDCVYLDERTIQRIIESANL